MGILERLRVSELRFSEPVLGMTSGQFAAQQYAEISSLHTPPEEKAAEQPVNRGFLTGFEPKLEKKK